MAYVEKQGRVRHGSRIAQRLVKRALFAVATLTVLSVIAFVATNIVPVDPARTNLGRGATEEQLELYRRQFGLDMPIHLRYWGWLSSFITGDLGISMSARRAVSDVLSTRVLPTVGLASAAVIVAMPVSAALGIFAGRRSGKRSDFAISTGVLFLGGVPPFVLGLILIAIFSLILGWLPPDSTAVAYQTGWARAEGYLLPVVTLAAAVTPYLTQSIRTSVRETDGSPPITSARLRGTRPRPLVWRHIVPIISGQTVAVTTLSMADLILGVVVVETVFGFPGLGQLLVSSVASRDVAVVQAIVLLAGTAYIVLNLLSDWLNTLLDPRIRSDDDA